jgi:predicted DNA-binding ribbon-helix-helix protein
MPKSAIAKRSIVFNGKKTSLSLREHANLSSAIRLFVLDYYRNQAQLSDRFVSLCPSCHTANFLERSLSNQYDQSGKKDFSGRNGSRRDGLLGWR